MASTFPFKRATACRIIFPILDADGDPVPDAAGLDSEVSIDGGTFADCGDEAHNIANPGGATNTGLYYLDLTVGEMTGDVISIQVKTSTSGAKTTMLVIYTAGQTDNDTKVVLDGIAVDYAKTGEATTASSQGEAAAALATWTSTYAAQLTRILGLIQENQYIDTTVFDSEDHMTSARLRTYSVAGSVGTDNDVLATYTVTATYDASGNMVTFKVVKV